MEVLVPPKFSVEIPSLDLSGMALAPLFLTMFLACGGGGSSTSNAPDNPAAVAPSIRTQPADQTTMAGQTATFSVVASGTAPLSYQWKKPAGPIPGNLPAKLRFNTIHNLRLSQQ